MSTLSLLAIAGGGEFEPLDVGGAGNFLWTLIIFLISLPFMVKLVFSKIAASMNERDAKAAEAIVAAEKASKDAEEARAAAEVAAGEARAEAAKLMAGARERAEARERDIIETAKKEADAMIEKARTQIQAEQEKALSAIRNEVVDLSLTAATKVLGRSVDGEDDRRLVQELVGAQSKDGAS